VVSTAVGGAPEVIEHGVSGFLVRPGDATALADRISEALTSEDRLRDMGLQGRQRVHDQFTFTGQARAYRRLFAELKGAPTTRIDDARAVERSASRRIDQNATENKADLNSRVLTA
jgi:DNA-binding NtrC family response regulator